jgi:hypothetical protein
MSRQADIQLGADLLPPTGAVTARDGDAPSAPVRRDPRRILQAAAIVAGPVLMTAFQLLNPAILPREEAGRYLSSIAADPDRFAVAMVCYLLAMVAGIPTAAATLRLTRHKGRLLGLAGAVFSVLGVAAGLATAGMQLGTLGLIADGAVLPYGAEAFARFQGGPGFHLVVDPVACAILGFLCTAIALGVSRKVPLWVPFALFGGLVLGSNEFGWIVTVAGTMIQIAAVATVARALLRDPS